MFSRMPPRPRPSVAESRPAETPDEISLGWAPERVAAFRARILAFFRQSGRSLSWRESRDPYRILVSEVMLQQTRVETATPYFNRWMERFPDFETLAAAEEEEVLNLWAGLGYYSRARRLQQTVREVVHRYDGRLPEAADELERLPGIGPYTAGAIASIAFGEAVPAVDGNVRRVLSRLSDVGAPSPETLRRWGRELVDPEDPGGFNQALMELGSLICIPRNPECKRCPVGEFCAAKAAETQTVRPTPTRKKPAPQFGEAVAMLVRLEGGKRKLLLRRRPPGGLLAGMWEFPGVEIRLDADAREAALTLALRLLGVEGESECSFEQITPLPHLDHAFSHKKVRYLPFLVQIAQSSVDPDSGGSVPEVGNLRWATQDEAERLPLSAAQRTLSSWVPS